MRLNKPQAKAFEQFRKFRVERPSYASYLRRTWWFYLFLLLCGIGGVAFGYAVDQPWMGGVLAGMIIGVALRDEALIRSARLTWPALEAVLDWYKIDQMLQERTNRLREAKSQREPSANPPAQPPSE